jgi:transposase-like protein
MTETRLPLAELLEKAGDGDFLRAVAEAVLQLLMEADVEGLIGAARHERTAERQTYRNGYRDRALDTRLGTLQLRIPKLRAGPSSFPPFLEPRKTSEKALVAVIQEAWIGGVSTRRVDELAQAMGLAGLDESRVSRLCKEIDERVTAFLERPLAGEWPYLWLDATYLKVREGGRIVSVAAIIAVAVDAEGRREIVGLHLGPSEAETFWTTFLKGLLRRGLKGVKLVVSDAHEGLKGAIRRVLGATWQRCRVHTIRTQSTIGLRFDARGRAAQRDDMADLQAVLVDDDPLDDEAQDGLPVGEAGVVEPASHPFAEGGEVGRHRPGGGPLPA